MGQIFVALAGNIGSGKTTLTKLLSDYYGWDPYFEAVKNNPYLADFYSDMRRWALPQQVFFLTNRFQAHKRIMGSENSAIQDRTIYEDVEIFVNNLFESGRMEVRDYETYRDLYNLMIPYLKPPDLIIYIRKRVPTLLRRIAQRGRPYEQSIPVEYLEKLNELYDRWIQKYSFGRTITLESDELDFIHSDEDFTHIRHLVVNALDQPDLFIREDQPLPDVEHRIRVAGSPLGS